MGTAHDESILHSLRRISRALDVFSRRLALVHNLTTPQLICLRLLAGDGLTPSRLAKEAALSQATVTGIVDRLEARGLVARRRDQRDRRRVSLYLTDEGRQMLAAAPPPLHELFAARLARLPQLEQQSIDEVLKRIAGMMEDGIPAEGAPAQLAGEEKT